MKAKCKKAGGFTLAELMVVIVIIAILMALLLPAILRGSKAKDIAVTRTKISSISMAVDSFYRDFGFYPPTSRAFNPDTGQFDGAPYHGFGYSEALVQCLCNKFTKGAGDLPVNKSFMEAGVPTFYNVYQGHEKIMGNAPVTVEPYLQVKPSDLADKDADRFPELVDAWGNAFIYVPKDDYFQADGTTYNAGAGTWNDADADGVLVNADGTLDPGEFREHFQRFRFQLISLGPDGWTAGLYWVLEPPRTCIYWDISFDKPLPNINPCPQQVGTDCIPTRPLDPAGAGADDLNNWTQ